MVGMTCVYFVQEGEGEKTYLKYSTFTFLFTNSEIGRFKEFELLSQLEKRLHLTKE